MELLSWNNTIQNQSSISDLVIVMNTLVHNDLTSQNRKKLILQSLIEANKLWIQVILVDWGSQDKSFISALKRFWNVYFSQWDQEHSKNWFKSYGEQIRYTCQLTLDIFSNRDKVFLRTEPEKYSLITRKNILNILNAYDVAKFRDIELLMLTRRYAINMPPSQFESENLAAQTLNAHISEECKKKIFEFPNAQSEHSLSNLLFCKNIEEYIGSFFWPMLMWDDWMHSIANSQVKKWSRDGNEILFVPRFQSLNDQKKGIAILPIDYLYDFYYEFLPELQDTQKMIDFRDNYSWTEDWFELFSSNHPTNLALKRILNFNGIIPAIAEELRDFEIKPDDVLLNWDKLLNLITPKN